MSVAAGSHRHRRVSAKPSGLVPAAAAPGPWYPSLGAAGTLSSPLGARALEAAVHLVLPIALGAVVLLFLVVQAQIDKRGPRLTGAPIRREGRRHELRVNGPHTGRATDH